MKPIDFVGRRIDPAEDDFFKALIQYGNELKSEGKSEADAAIRIELDSKQFITKTIANATS